MNSKELFINDVLARYQSKGDSKKLDPLSIAVIMAIIEQALKILINSKCLANIFPTYYVNKSLKQASRVVEKEYNTVRDFYKEYCDDNLTQSIIEVKQSLTNQEVKDILNDISIN